MHNYRSRCSSLLLLCALLPATLALAVEPEAPVFQEIEATGELLDAIRQGGYVLYMRHGATDSAYPDQVPIHLDDCNTQRPLTDSGREEIAQVGKAVKRAGIPIGEIFASPLCRARESAQLAYGDGFTTVNELMYTAHLTSAEKLPVVAMTRKLLTQPVAAGSNRVIVAHAPNLADLMAYFPKVEGSLIIFRPTEDGEFVYLATIYPTHWTVLLGEDQTGE